MRVTTALILVAGMTASGLVVAEPATAASTTFVFTGAAQSYQVPAGVTSIIVDAWGAQGGPGDISQCGSGGFGAHTRSVVQVTPKETLQVYVGGAGGIYAGSDPSSQAGGFNGGGDGRLDTVGGSRGGGGASDVRRAPYALTDRLVVAGGGGGAGNLSGATSGGAGGGSSGAAGTPSAHAGKGGTQTQGGAAGPTDTPVVVDATAGTRGQGGEGGYASGTGAFTGGGGGGGWFGGGGAGGGSTSPGAGGGGGSSHGPPGSVLERGVRGVLGACTDVLDGKVVIQPTPSNGTSTAVTPKRILDTRSGLGAKKGKVGKGRTVALQVTGHGGVPKSGVGNVALQVSVLSPTSTGFATAYACGHTRPAVYSVAFSANESVTRLVTSPVSSGGKVCIYVSASAHLVADVSGYFRTLGQPLASRFTPVVSALLVDTGKGSVVKAGKVLKLTVLGQRGVPTSGVSAVLLNLVARSPAATGQVTAYPCGITRPRTTSLSFARRHSQANLAMVTLGTHGQVCVVASVTTPLAVDVSGWYGKPGAGAGSAFKALKPHRILDTVSGVGATNQPVPAHGSISVTAKGRAAVPTTGVIAVVLDVRALHAAGSGRVNVYTCGHKVSAEGTVYVERGRVVATQVVVALNASGQFCVSSTVRTDVMADVLGWYGAS